jgi:23S rRNA (uracil1939-C5)-methyltransferase
MRETILTIDHLGHRGDGVARTEHGPVYVPNTLPGETVRVSMSGERASVIELLSPSPQRAEPFCPHFAVCGGCTSQHMEEAAYKTWKHAIVETALRNRAIDADIGPLIDAHGAGRRRATFHARKSGADWIVGYSAQRSHHVVALQSCPILVPALVDGPKQVAALANALSGLARFDAQLTQTDTGIDVRLTGLGEIDLKSRTALAEAAHTLNLARITADDETIVARTTPRVQMGPVSIVPPPGAFLQATEEGERVIADLVCTHLKGLVSKGTAKIGDLFCGLGPFALRLATNAAIEAFDSDQPAIGALTRAANETPKLRPLKASTRDLFVRPLLANELDRFDGIVLDPPRAGAEAQIRMLAASKVPAIVSVSCDPATFARDSALLLAGGYRLEQVTPIDQFKWSPHIEAVGLFRR